MNYRLLGRTGMKVSEISFGAWAIGLCLGTRWMTRSPWPPCTRRWTWG